MTMQYMTATIMMTLNISVKNMPRHSHFSPPWGGRNGLGIVFTLVTGQGEQGEVSDQVLWSPVSPGDDQSCWARLNSLSTLVTGEVRSVSHLVSQSDDERQ